MTLQLLGHQCAFETVATVLDAIDVQQIVDEVWSPSRRRPLAS
jgi:hypothetical protein